MLRKAKRFDISCRIQTHGVLYLLLGMLRTMRFSKVLYCHTGAIYLTTKKLPTKNSAFMPQLKSEIKIIILLK